MSSQLLNISLFFCLSSSVLISSVLAQPLPRGQSSQQLSGNPPQKLSDEQELILASSSVRREMRDYLRQELKRRALPVYKLPKGKSLDVQALAEYTAAKGNRMQLLTLIAVTIHTPAA